MFARGSGSAEEAIMQDETVLEEETDLEPDEFGIEPEADDPSYNADLDDVHGSHDLADGAR
jgi:hypothetical protein